MNEALIDLKFAENFVNLLGDKLSGRDLFSLMKEAHSLIKQDNATQQKPLVPAVPISESVTDEYIICLEDGKKFQTLKKHLKCLGMTEWQYKKKWGLDENYPMVASRYSEKRSSIRKKYCADKGVKRDQPKSLISGKITASHLFKENGGKIESFLNSSTAA